MVPLCIFGQAYHILPHEKDFLAIPWGELNKDVKLLEDSGSFVVRKQ